MSEETAFVLGGGGLRGAAEVGMIKALAETDIRPGLVVGTSVGSINGAMIASGDLPRMAVLLEDMWLHLEGTGVLREGWLSRVATITRHRTHLHSNAAMRDLLDHWLPHRTFQAMPVSFQCVAACIETSAEWWFDSGPLVQAILASCAVPGLLPPVEVDGRHFVDGGVVNSIPISRAIDLGATTVYVLHVGNIDSQLRLPRNAWDVAFVAFEIARRHRFHRDLQTLPTDVSVHVLPTGGDRGARFNDPAKLRYTRTASIRRGIEEAYQATAEYLAADR